MLWVSKILFLLQPFNQLIGFSWLVLHLTHKLKYFVKQCWDKEWISTAEEIVRDKFRQNYSTYIVHKKGRTSQLSKKVNSTILAKSKQEHYLQLFLVQS